MKLCCSSRSHSRMFASGDLTQLEWIDMCAHALMLDGVEVDAAHFPRTDDDYLAQVKKLCVDRCLTLAAVALGEPVGAGGIDEHVEAGKRWVDVACALGAPLVRFGCVKVSGSPGVAWSGLIRGLKHVCAHAKLKNVTLALEPGPEALVQLPADVKRALKECDSAWLRLSLPAPLFVSARAQEWIAHLADAIFVPMPVSRLDTFGADENVDGRGALSVLAAARYRGFVSLEYGGAESEGSAVPRAVAWLRDMLARLAQRAALDAADS